jgi:hypothetical protein
MKRLLLLLILGTSFFRVAEAGCGLEVMAQLHSDFFSPGVNVSALQTLLTAMKETRSRDYSAAIHLQLAAQAARAYTQVMEGISCHDKQTFVTAVVTLLHWGDDLDGVEYLQQKLLAAARTTRASCSCGTVW